MYRLICNLILITVVVIAVPLVDWKVSSQLWTSFILQVGTLACVWEVVVFRARRGADSLQWRVKILSQLKQGKSLVYFFAMVQLAIIAGNRYGLLNPRSRELWLRWWAQVHILAAYDDTVGKIITEDVKEPVDDQL